MAKRTNADLGLVDAWTASLSGPRTAALLDRLDRAVAWETLVKPIAALPEYAGGAKGGRPAYRSVEREADLHRRGVCCAIAFKRTKGQPDLPPALKRLSRVIASVRAAVEHPFAWMKTMGYRRVRYRVRRRNELDFALMLVAHNWKRSLSLKRPG